MRPSIFTLTILLFAAGARAAPPTPADALIDKGIALRQQHKDQEALDVFQQAHAASPSARTLAQMGLAEASLHRWIDAEAHLSDALDSHDTPWIQSARNRDVLSQTLLLVRTHVGLISIVGPADVEITVAGQSVGRLPISGPLHLAEGRARIEGAAPGRESAAVNLPVPGGQQQTVHLEMPLLPTPATLPTAPTAPSAATSVLDTHAETEGSTWRPWTVGLLAVSAGLIATGAVWIAMDGHGTCNPPPGDYRCLRVYDTKTQGLITAGVGAAGVVASGLIFWHYRHAEAELSLGLGTLSASGTF
jgi:hypothetical protein